MNEKIKRIIRDWVKFHGFEDDCGYPLLASPYLKISHSGECYD